MKFHHFSKLYYEHEHFKIFILLGLTFLVVILIITKLFYDQINLSKKPQFGISYSPSYAQALGLDWKSTFLSLLEDLNVKNLRLAAYWNEIEPEQGKYDFSDLDWLISEASKHQARVILAIGYKLPRWPECRSPGWLNLENAREKNSQQLLMMEAVIAHFEGNPTIFAWQIENEPLFRFGLCPTLDKKFVETEIALVKSKTKKPVMLTDSGELSTWITAMKSSDYFGTTLYRIVHDKFLGRIRYPIQPWFYRTKHFLVQKLFAPKNQKSIIVELQAEPWVTKFMADTPMAEQLQTFPLIQFEENVDYAKKVGFEEIYLWGAEWWYFAKNMGQPQYLNYAKTLFK
ncbi:MAG: beta-galactosidase [Candidatus Daviesbacteria bacterium]